MKKLTFVMGGTATGKSHYINQHFSGIDVEILDIYTYQQKAYDEAGFGEGAFLPFDERLRCLKNANEMHLYDIIMYLKEGRNVVAEQTFYKAKLRVAYIDAIRTQVPDAYIEIHFISPPEAAKWREYIKLKRISKSLQGCKAEAEEIEFPNPAEGFDAIYEVVDGEPRLRMEPAQPEIVEEARKALATENEMLEQMAEGRKQYKELLESMKIRPFWHYCEVCGAKAYITADEAFKAGWDYPPQMGTFRFLGPRKCGNCGIEKTLYWKIHTQQSLPIVLENTLTPEEKETWRRIRTEPESLLPEEEN